MTKEIIEDTQESPEDQEQLSPEAEKAIDGGWRPQEEWEGEADEWIDARTFNMRGELMDRIKSQTSQLRGQDRKISKLEGSMQHLAEHNKKMDEVAFTKAMKELKGLKRDALDMADHDQVIELDDQINDLKDIQRKGDMPAPEAPSQDMNPEVVAWVDNNPWYTTDTTLRGAAEALAREVLDQNPGLRGSPSTVLEMVSKQLKEEFPAKFGKTPRRGTAQSVAEPGQADTSNRSRGSTKKFSSKHLNEVQMEYGRNFVRDGVMKNLNEYASQLAELGELDAQKGA